MSAKNLTSSEQRFVKETAEQLSSTLDLRVIKKIHELKSNGKPIVLPLILDLLLKSRSDAVKNEVLILIGQLKDQACVPIIVTYVNFEKAGAHLANLISACWQSDLDFSKHLILFVDSFITGDYQVALEAFTVIEESLWRSTPEAITECHKYLSNRKEEIETEKILLFHELIKVLGRSSGSQV
jgi:hypothetical protein